MTPAESVPSEVHDPAASGALDSSGQARQPKRDQRAARKRANASGNPPEDDSALLAWAYTEYQRLRAEGQAPDIPQWAACFPHCRSELRQMLEFELFTAGVLDRDSFSGPTPLPPDSDDESIPWPDEGDRRADFTILRELARGTFARVYLATECSTGGRLVVLKCSLHGDAEARTLGRLVHPNIVPILSARKDEQSGLTLVCMPYLGSATLEDVLQRLMATEAPPCQARFLFDVIRSQAQPEDPKPATVDSRLLHGSYTDGVIQLAAQLADTLTFLHQHGVCHRDLKPSNVLLDASGKALLLDFNLSKSEREAVIFIGGTLRYMAPEQILAFRDGRKDGLDARVDLYALGVIVYELLGGDHPCAALFESSIPPSKAQPLLKALKGGFRPFREVCPELARPVAAVLDRCVAFEASDRPNSALELATALKRQFTPVRRLHRRLATHRRKLLATLGLLLVSVVVSAYVWAVTPPYSQREYARGRSAYRAGDFNAAELHFENAWRAEPNDLRSRYARGCARLQQSKYLPKDKVKFEQIWDDLVSMESGAADAHTMAVNAYIQVRNQHFDDAIRMYNNPVLAAYRPVMVLNNRAYAYMGKRLWEKAQTDLDKAVKLEPLCQAVRYNRALVAMRMRMQGKTRTLPSHALDDMEQALRSEPKHSTLYSDAAVLYALAAKDEPQKAHFERALSFLRQAIASGEPAAKFSPIPSLKKALDFPDLADLVRYSPSKPSQLQELRLIDPVDLLD